MPGVPPGTPSKRQIATAMKTREQEDGKPPLEKDQSTYSQRWTQMESASAKPADSESSPHPTKPFRIRASEGSSVFNLLFRP